MSLCFYSERQTPFARELYSRLSRLRRGGEKLTVNRISNFEPGPDVKTGVGDVVVLCAGSNKELDTIISKREMFADSRVILVLPDNGDETIHKGYMLKPRFMDFPDSDQGALIDVIKSVLARDRHD